MGRKRREEPDGTFESLHLFTVMLTQALIFVVSPLRIDIIQAYRLKYKGTAPIKKQLLILFFRYYICKEKDDYKMNCPRCNHKNPDDTNYCGKCGMPLLAEDVTAVYNPETLKFLLQEMSRGTVIADRYEVIEELGRGGMGTVYKVFDKKIKEKIALKLIRPEIALNEHTIERFQNELRIALLV